MSYTIDQKVKVKKDHPFFGARKGLLRFMIKQGESLYAVLKDGKKGSETLFWVEASFLE